jgi:hypothetical protein
MGFEQITRLKDVFNCTRSQLENAPIAKSIKSIQVIEMYTKPSNGRQNKCIIPTYFMNMVMTLGKPGGY